MDQKTSKPRLVFFQWNHSGLPEFMKLHMQQHVKCLSEFFEVISINKDCDYRQICDKYEPDLTLFESGWKSTISKKINVKNTSTYSEVPKLGLHNGDPWCAHRAGFISDMEQLGIGTFFSIGTTTAEHTPEIAENLYVWPNFIDDDIYHDYGLIKTVPVLLTGCLIPLYPWRKKIFKIIADNYSPVSLPHLGYEDTSSQMLCGEQYARVINSSWFVPTCGSIAKEVVRKHFEIPGCNSCLITEQSASLEAAGFVDMKNCVFADEKNVIDKLNYLFKNMDELEKIIREGYKLVQKHHTIKQRDQIFQWFNLYKSLKPGQKIIQENPFQALSIVEKSAGFKSTPITSGAVHLELLRQGDNKLWTGNYSEAEAFYLECLNYDRGISEPKLRLTLCSLYKGKSSDALKWIVDPIRINIGIYGALEPDPAEWAYYIVCLLCKGKLNKATIRANQFSSLLHPELDRTRWIINYLHNKKNNDPIPDVQSSRPRYSIHQFPQLGFLEWADNISKMLKACKQDRYAETITNVLYRREKMSGRSKEKLYSTIIEYMHKNLLSLRIKWLKNLNRIFKSLNILATGPELPPFFEIDYMIKFLKWVKVYSRKRLKFILAKLYTD